MSFEKTRYAVTNHFVTGWNPSHLPIVYENQQEGNRTAAWGRFVVLFGGSIPMTIGNQGFVRTIGMAALQIFIPEAGGTKGFTDNADRFANLFNLQVIRYQGISVHFHTAGLSGVSKNNGWSQQTVSVSYRSDTRS